MAPSGRRGSGTASSSTRARAPPRSSRESAACIGSRVCPVRRPYRPQSSRPYHLGIVSRRDLRKVRVGRRRGLLDYRELGRSGLQVSAFGLGVMTFGGQTPEADALRQLDMAFEAGVTLFDTAENYPTPTGPETQGRSEEVIGRWFAARGLRDKVVVATKVAGPGNAAGDMTHIRGAQRRLDRANIRAACEASLHRLGTDHIDLYQLHWPERAVTTLGRSRYSRVPDAPEQVAIEETLAALGELVAEGKVRAIGVCNESPWGVMRFLAEAERA
ncbi:MAG: hypothetical protein EOO76_16980, partial [Novosphingobium sp.]